MTHRPTYRTSDFTRLHLPTVSPFDQTETLIMLPQAAPRFHMPSYLLGTPERVYLMSSSEVCRTEYDASDKRHAWFVKNGNSEEMAVFNGAVWRFTDTSPNEAEYYQLWRTTGEPGAKWCPEVWGVGEPYLRECEVRFFHKANGQPSKPRYVDVTYLEIIAHHPTKGFPGGIAIQDVLELAWYSNPAAKLERYWYAKGWGLVGFSNAHGFSSYVTKKEFAPAPVRKVFTGVVPMVLPPIEKEPEQAPQYLRRELNAGANMRIREPKADGSADPKGRELIKVPDGELIDVDVSSVTKPAGQALEWVRVMWLDERDADALVLYKGWMGILEGKTLDTQFKDTQTGEQPIPEEPEPPTPDPDDLPNGTPATIHDVDKLRADMIAHSDLQGATLLSELEKERAARVHLQARVDALERTLRGLGPYVEKELPLAG